MVPDRLNFDKEQVSHLLRKRGSEDLWGTKVAQAAVQSQQEINGGIIVQPSSLGGFKIHLSEGSSLGSSTSESLFRT